MEAQQAEIGADEGIAAPPQQDDAGENQEEAPSRFRAEDDLPRVLSQDDPDRMKLTEQEHEWAVDIKEVVEGLTDLDNLNDFMYAQLAIICKNNTDDAIQRCYGMQEFRQEYKILDTHEEGERYLGKMFQMFPREYLSFSFSQKDGVYVFIHDAAKFEPKAFTAPDMADDWLCAMFYSHILFIPDLESVRKGIICLVECEGLGMRRDVMKHFQNFFSQFLSFYPFFGHCHHYHTGTMINVISSILRKILPNQELQETYKVGLQFDGHMGDAFLVPTVELANKRMKARMLDNLQRRYNHEKSFSLG